MYCESVWLPACLAKYSKVIMGELQDAQMSGATHIFFLVEKIVLLILGNKTIVKYDICVP